MSTRIVPPKGSSGAVKKLVIKPLKVQPELPSNFEEVTWAKLQDAVNAVHCSRPVSCSLEALYTAVQDMCIHKMADKLYAKLQLECDAHVASQLTGLRQNLQLEAVKFLDRIDVVWRGHCEQMLTICQIFLYLDRTYVITTASVRSLFDMGLQLFRKHMASHPEVEAHTVSGLLQLISRERGGEAVDRPLLKSLLHMFTSLGTYADAFQRPFLISSAQAYRAEGDRLMAEIDVPAYLVHCETRLSEEYERCQVYLNSSATKQPLVAEVERELIQRHLPAVLDKGFAQLMDANRVEDLARLYVLAGRVAALDALKVAFRDYIRTFGTKIVKDEDKDKEMVDRLLEFKARLERIMDASFCRNEAFSNALKEAFENFINTRQSKPAELVAKFIDARLRAGSKGARDEDLDVVLDKALILFRYIQGKDVFEAFFKKDLAKRLLLGKSASIDAEKSLISKLKAECGSQFTNKLEGMFTDVALSSDVMTAFRQSATQRAAAASKAGGANVEMSVSVLTSGFWPTYPIMEAKLPQELASYQEVFMGHYLSKHSGRRLAWHNSLGTCVLRAHFPKGVKELSVSLFQTVVLMLFNDVEQLSFPDIKEQSGIEDKELRRTLQSLACGKVRVLVKEPKGREVDDTDVFRFNADFSERLFRIKINSIQMKETEEENKKTNDQVLQDRQYQIDAALVRIMKTRKTLSHKLLVQEALQQLKFPLKGTDLKKRIESLIEREYMQRDAHDANIYNYMA